MIRLLAVICIFVIVIGLYSHWRYPNGQRAETDPVSTVVTPTVDTPEPGFGTLEDPVPDDLTPDAEEPVESAGGKERSLDR